MNFSLFYQLKNNQSRWTKIVFYSAWGLLAVSILCYIVFASKVYLENQSISDLNKKLAAYDTPLQKANEKLVLGEKKKVDDFATIIASHKISLNVFDFIQQKTLPNVWFSNIIVSELQNSITLLGETESLATLSDQVNLFEQSKNEVQSINVLSSQVGAQGKIDFTLNITLDPKFFSSNVVLIPPAPSSNASISPANGSNPVNGQ